ncbi:MAG: hypothetical protein U0800_03490 [Isosphaeraceae bacterium]
MQARQPLGFGRARPVRPFRPSPDLLESRQLLALAPVLTALTSHRYWIDYAPSHDPNSPGYDPNPTEAHVRADLTNLYREGFRGLVTYTLQGTYDQVPKIAKSVGFLWVIAGVYNPGDAAEVGKASSAGVLPYADAFVVGNEGLTIGNRYSYQTLSTAIGTVQQATGKPVSTSEPGGAYYKPNGSNAPYATQLLALGDWLFPNIDYFLWGNQPSTPQAMWTNVSFAYQYMKDHQSTPGPVVAKEVAYPSAGGAQASDANQIAWYHDQAAANLVGGSPFYFAYFEAYDQPWKSTIDAYEPHMGLNGINNADGTARPKPAVAALQGDIVGAYPGSGIPAFAGAQGLPIQAAPGAGFQADLATFSDPNNPIAPGNDHYAASVSWGDGTGFQAADVTISGSSITVHAGHTYASAGQYTVQVALQRGSGYGQVVQATANVATPLASVASMTPRVGKGPKASTATAITLQFNEAVSGAGTLKNYRLQSGTIRKGVARFNAVVPLASARYNASTHTVVLTLKAPIQLSGLYRLTAFASRIRNAAARPLDGNADGVAGGDYLAVFGGKKGPGR